MNTKSIWKFTEYTGYEVEIIDKCLCITKNQQETRKYRAVLDSEYFFRLQKTQITVSDLTYFVNRLEKDKDEPITWRILDNIWNKVKPLKNNK